MKDFFQHQDEARKASRLLSLYFVLAVIAVIVCVHLALSFLLMWISSRTLEPFDWWRLDRFVVIAGATLLVILAGSLYKIARLSEGGATVARLLGGRPIDPNTRDLAERRLLNVVEEMAIAAGVPVPTVYLLDREEGINAFAAGFTPQDAVLGVTRGTMRLLGREELQGVVAHEFSHIFNGDMKLNLRLMGVLHGILVIALIGYFILRSGVRGGSGRKGAVGFVALGVALVAIGYVGVFFGRLIKSAVSREREFLADASAVQFTRNPLGLGGALKKIGGLAHGSLVMSPHAEQASHFFFSDGRLGKVRMALTAGRFQFFSSHPPLAERIRRVDPAWDGRYPEVQPVREVLSETPPARPEGKSSELFSLLPAQLTALVGTLDEAHLAHVRRLLSGIPERLREAVHEPAGARAVILALLASREPEVREGQLRLLSSDGDGFLEREVREIAGVLADARREVRLPLVDLAVPALRRLSRSQYDAFRKEVEGFVRADRQIDLFEYTLTHVLERHLAPAFDGRRPPKVEFYALSTLAKECSVLLSAVAHAGQKEKAAAEGAFREGARELSGVAPKFLPLLEAGLPAVKESLSRLERLAPRAKKDLLRALIAVAVRDRKITVGEGEVLRAISDALGLPMPPFLPGQEIRTAT